MRLHAWVEASFVGGSGLAELHAGGDPGGIARAKGVGVEAWAVPTRPARLRP